MDNWLNYGASIPQHATCNNLNEPEGNYGELVKKINLKRLHSVRFLLCIICVIYNYRCGEQVNCQR